MCTYNVLLCLTCILYVVHDAASWNRYVSVFSVRTCFQVRMIASLSFCHNDDDVDITCALDLLHVNVWVLQAIVTNEIYLSLSLYLALSKKSPS